MKYLFFGGIAIVVVLIASKLIVTLNAVYFNDNIIVRKAQKSNSSKEFMKTGRSIYLVYCSSCHGKDGKGNNDKAQDHTKRIAKKSVFDVIMNGSNNFKSIYPSGMPAGLLDEDDAKDVAQYVANGLKGRKPEAWQTCASCHDQSGEGIAYVAPNIKVYSDQFVSTVLTNGKKGTIGTMPSFKGRLTDMQMQAVANHIRSLGK